MHRQTGWLAGWLAGRLAGLAGTVLLAPTYSSSTDSRLAADDDSAADATYGRDTD